MIVAPRITAGRTTAYYPWAGQPLPMRQGGSFYVLHSDRNGSITAVTDSAGSLVGQQRYIAYGKMTPAGSFPTDRGYTGQIRDGSDAGSLWDFYFFTSRYYNAAIGKFFQPDTASPHWANPQSLNPYAYALNSPLRLIDPSGHFTVDELKALGYSAAQTTSWEKNNPEWAAIVVAGRIGDVVTGLYPYTSGPPAKVQGDLLQVPAQAMRGGQRLALVGSLGVQTLGAFGRQVQSPSLWRPSSPSITGPRIGSESAYRLVPTPHTFLRERRDGDITLEPTSGPDLGEHIHATARAIHIFTSNLDPFSAGPFKGQSPSSDIGLSASWEATGARAFPSTAGEGDKIIQLLGLGAAAYDAMYWLIWGNH